MGSKWVYLCLTLILVVASIGTGFAARQEKGRHMKAALQSLETARMQLVATDQGKSVQQAKALELVEKAIREVRSSLPVQG